MREGKLRHRVTYQEPVEVLDSFRQRKATFDDPSSTVGTYWAEVLDLSGREAVYAQQVRAEATHQVTMRRATAIRPTGRFVFQGRHLNILSAVLDPKHKQYTILCKEVVAGA